MESDRPPWGHLVGADLEGKERQMNSTISPDAVLSARAFTPGMMVSSRPGGYAGVAAAFLR